MLLCAIMRKLLTIFLILLGTMPVLAADYVVKPLKIQELDSYPAQATLEDITVAVDPYVTDEKSYSAFDFKHLNSRGYFPVHVIIQNNTSDFLIMRTRNIILITSSGEQLYSTPITVILDDIFNPTSVDKLSKNKPRKKSKKAAIGSPLTDFSTKDLTNKLVDPGKVSSGFLFFTNPDPKKNIFAGSTLFIPKIEEEGTRKSVGPFSIPLDPALASSSAEKGNNP
jgi:hypothetical protein